MMRMILGQPDELLAGIERIQEGDRVSALGHSHDGQQPTDPE